MTADAAPAVPAVPALRIEVAEPGDGTVVVRVVGELDTAASAGLRGALADVLARPGAQGCVVDLTAVTFLDCAGVRPVVDAHAAARRSGRSLAVRTGPDPAVGRLLGLTGLRDVLAPSGGPAAG